MIPLIFIKLDSDEEVSEEDLEDLDDDQIIKIFKDAGIMKKNKDEVKEG